jgi:hypothetical protein
MTTARPAALGLLCALAAAACSDAASARKQVERTDSAGVEIVHNLGGDRPLAWRFEEVLRLGGADEGPESFYRLNPSSVGVDGRGNLHVLDGGNHRVAIFDPRGHLLRVLGREGGGPGELEIPLTMDVASDGTVRVHDITKPALVQWDSAGGLLPSRPLPVTLTREFARVGDALVAPVPTKRSEDGRSGERLLAMRAADTTELAAIAVPPVSMMNFGCVGLALPPLFSPSLVWSAAEDRVAVVSGGDYVIRLVKGAHASSIRRDLAPRTVTREMALQDVGEEMTIRFGNGAPPCEIPGATVVEKQGFARVLPAIAAITLAPDGSTWVRRGAVKGETPIIDVFDAEGAYLGTLPAGSPFPAAFTPEGNVVAIERDDMDVDRLVVYRVRRGG